MKAFKIKYALFINHSLRNITTPATPPVKLNPVARLCLLCLIKFVSVGSGVMGFSIKWRGLKGGVGVHE